MDNLPPLKWHSLPSLCANQEEWSCFWNLAPGLTHNNSSPSRSLPIYSRAFPSTGDNRVYFSPLSSCTPFSSLKWSSERLFNPWASTRFALVVADDARISLVPFFCNWCGGSSCAGYSCRRREFRDIYRHLRLLLQLVWHFGALCNIHWGWAGQFCTRATFDSSCGGHYCITCCPQSLMPALPISNVHFRHRAT